MQWIDHYSLFLFDFDGLLADTEKLHYLAYKEACLHRGLDLGWDEHQYAKVATFSASGLREALVRRYPKLAGQWEQFYQEKKKHFLQILQNRKTELMPGAAPLLEEVARRGKVSCVVTNSPAEQVGVIRSAHPCLSLITHWITREQYKNAKPDPECYQLACSTFAKPTDRIIGFEDSPRGLFALTKIKATAVLVTKLLTQEELKDLQGQMKFIHAKALGELNISPP